MLSPAAATASTGASRRFQPTTTVSPYHLPLRERDVLIIETLVYVLPCPSRSYGLTSDLCICVQKALLGARDALEPARCSREAAVAEQRQTESEATPQERAQAREPRYTPSLADGTWL